MNHIRLSFSIPEQDKRETLIALLSDLDCSGFEETDDAVIAYFEQANYNEAAIKEIAEQLQVSYGREEMQQRNWNEEWEKNFEPVIIDGFCSVRADFHPKPDNVQYDIVITPKMSFGTGHHATTALMMSFMRHLDFTDKFVFDFGTGTGILAILAEMLGAKEVLAIDNDEWSFENAKENCVRNQAEKVTVRLSVADDIPDATKFDIILANINRHILLSYMNKMAEVLKSGGTLLLSGILPEDIVMIKEAAVKEGLIFQQEKTERNWACLQFVKN